MTVTDPMNRFVTGLEKEHFKLSEDKVGADDHAVLERGRALSASVWCSTQRQHGKQASEVAAGRGAVLQDRKSGRRVLPGPVQRSARARSRLHDNTEEIQNRLTFTQAKGRTALLDGVYLAMNQMKKAHNPRKAMMILSDGGDNSSRYTESEIKNLVREADVQVYAIGIFEPMAGRGRTAEEMAGPGLLTELAESTGGRHFPVENLNELPDVAAKIGIELRNQYVLGYSPTNTTKDGKYRRVQVKLKQPRGLPPLKAFYRLGYYAPAQ